MESNWGATLPYLNFQKATFNKLNKVTITCTINLKWTTRRKSTCLHWCSQMKFLTRWVRCCGVTSNTLQCESLVQSSVVSGRKLVVLCEKHCLVLNWFVVLNLSCGHSLQTSGATKKLRHYEKSYFIPPAMMSFFISATSLWHITPR